MWFKKGLRCIGTEGGSSLMYLSRRWQVLWLDRPRWSAWRVPGFGWGLSVRRLDVVRLP